MESRLSDQSEPASGNASRRGRPARISRRQIVAAARAIAPKDLTMKAVADALQVDRKALHRHVGDREGLLDLVVADLFEEELQGIELPDDATWQSVLRAYAQALRDGLQKLGGVTEHFRLRGGAGSLMLPWAEHVLEALVREGFGVEESGSILTLVANVAISTAYENDAQVHPHLPEVARALGNQGESDFPLLREVVSKRAAVASADRDFQFDLNIIVAGLECSLAAKSKRRGR